jgi:hypothetical protein
MCLASSFIFRFRSEFALLKTEHVRVSREASYFIPTGIHRMDRMLSLVWEGPLPGVWKRIYRKAGRRPRGRLAPWRSSGLIRVRIGYCAQVIRLEVQFFMGSRRCRGFAVPGKRHLPACATSDLSLQTPFDRPALPSPLL